MRKINIENKGHKNKIYSLYIGRLLNTFIRSTLKDVFTGDRVAVITDDNVNRLYLSKFVEKVWAGSNYKPSVITITAGEDSKSRGTKACIENFLFKNNFKRNDLVIALGGGVVSDIAGFTASTYKRGIHWLIVPTTLLSMVDASIGGKTAINTDYGKNTLGAYYNPKAVFCDLAYLDTLSKRELKNGFVELVKHFLINGKHHFDELLRLTNNPDYQCVKGIIHTEFFDELLYKSIYIKKTIVEKDPTEQGLRKMLNLGHTIGHSLEKMFANISHGEAVAMGIMLEMRIGRELNITSNSAIEKVKAVFDKLGIVTTLKLPVSVDKLIYYMCNDKKNTDSMNIKFVILNDIGKLYQPGNNEMTLKLDTTSLHRILNNVLSDKTNQKN